MTEQLIQETPQDLCALWNKTALTVYEAYMALPEEERMNHSENYGYLGQKYFKLLSSSNNYMSEFRNTIGRAQRLDCYAFDSWLIGQAHKALYYRNQETYGHHMKYFIEALYDPERTMAHYITLLWG